MAGVAQDAAWFQHNVKTEPQRYEGLVDEPNALRELNVIDFLVVHPGSPEKVFLSTPTRLHIHYCQLTGYKANVATIEVRPLTGHVNYLMKASPSGPETSGHWVSFAWPTDVVIQRNHIDTNKLGVVVRTVAENDGVLLVPAYFSSTDSPPEFKVEQYSLALNIRQKSLDRLSYEIRPGKGSVTTCHYQNDLHPCLRTPIKSHVEAGSIVHFSISNVPAGFVAIHVVGLYHDSDETLDVNFHFFHQPQCE